MLSEQNDYPFPCEITITLLETRKIFEVDFSMEENNFQNKIKEIYRKVIHSGPFDVFLRACRMYAVLCRKDLKKQLVNKRSVRLVRASFYSIQRAAEEGDLQGLKEILDTRKVPINSQDDLGHTALYTAIRSNQIKVAQWLLEHGANPDVQQCNKSTALHCACYYGHPQGVALLLKAGASATIRNKYTHQAYMEIWTNSNADETEIYNIIEESQSSLWGKVAALDLHPSSFDKELNALVQKPGLVNDKYFCEQTLLTVASRQGKYDLAAWLIRQQADVDAQDKFRNTALHLAAMNNHLQVVDLLLSNFANPTILNSWNKKPLEEAKSDECRLLFHKQANLDPFTLIYDESTKRLGDVRWFKNYLDRNNLEQRDKDARTLLYVASKHGHLELVDYLVQQRAQVNCTQNRNSTPLHAAAYFGHPLVVAYLLEHGANPYQANDNGTAPGKEEPKGLDERVKKEIDLLFQKYSPIMSVPSGTYHVNLFDLDTRKKIENVEVKEKMNFGQLVNKVIDHSLSFPESTSFRFPTPLPFRFYIGKNEIPAAASLPVLQSITLFRNSTSSYMPFPVTLQFKKDKTTTGVRGDIIDKFAKFKQNALSLPTFKIVQNSCIKVANVELKFSDVQQAFTMDMKEFPGNKYPIFQIVTLSPDVNGRCDVSYPDADCWSLYQFHSPSACWFPLSIEGRGAVLPLAEGIYSVVWKVEVCRGKYNNEVLFTLSLFDDLISKIETIPAPLEDGLDGRCVHLRLPDHIKLEEYDIGYHGTRIEAIESIVIDGLVKPGTITATGKVSLAASASPSTVALRKS
eukprot:TRINITY_DN6977_c0_g1_i10.p1 TRINITY_DN6977_c0_g1~~TRINITY_DN6977_c0_g1_i10.p1  ORF type:complete len:802 (-),score=123.03 TRINITY_DN6977_c0_g1_i10:405-2810(-)